MSNKKSGVRRTARTKEAAVRMHERDKRFVRGNRTKSLDRVRAAHRARNKLKTYGMLILMELVMRDGLSVREMEALADALREAGFVALIERPDSIKLRGEPGLSMAFMARADMRGVLGRRFRQDLGRIFRDRSLIRQELHNLVEDLELVFPSIASVEPPRKG